jgi:hypothetical protein
LDPSHIEASTVATVEKLRQSLEGETNEWKKVIPGKQIFNIFASITKIDSGRLKLHYLREADSHPTNPFGDIIETFKHFAET